MRSTAHLLLLSSPLWPHTSAFSIPSDDQQPLVNAPSISRNPSNTFSPPPYRDQLLSLHKSLVDIPSLSGSEGDAAIYLERLLKSQNYTVELQCLPSDSTNDKNDTPSRCNVLAWPGANSSKTFDNRVLITSHIDVVPPYIPYHIDTDTDSITPDTLISGRGSVDAKASVAAQIVAVKSLLSSSSPTINPDSLVLLFVVGEEVGGGGMKLFSSSPARSNTQFRAAIFGEPTENKLACGHKGIMSGSVRAQGKAGHSGYPWLGKSATGLLIHALDKLLGTDLGSSERYGNITVNVGVLSGGVAANVIAKEASAKLAIRIAVGEEGTGAGIVEEGVRRVLREVDQEEGALEFEVTGGYGPVECECDVDGEFSLPVVMIWGAGREG